MRMRFLLAASLLFSLVVTSCDDGHAVAERPTPERPKPKQQRDSGPEMTAEEAGVFSARMPRNVAIVLGDTVTVSWTYFGYAVDFVVLRREPKAGSAWQEIAVVANSFPDPNLFPLTHTDTDAVSRATYVYGVKTRNNNKHGALVESAVVETAPVTVP